MGEHKNLRARRVQVSLDSEGRSTFVEDLESPTRLATDAYTLNQIWQATTVPVPMSAENTLGTEAVIPPPPEGFTFVVATFPPDAEWDYEAGWAKALADSGAADSVSGGQIPGLHATETIDLVTIITGEIYAITETGETLLRPGDSLVQRGTKHAWSNRGLVPCTISCVHVAASRT